MPLVTYQFLTSRNTQENLVSIMKIKERLYKYLRNYLEQFITIRLYIKDYSSGLALVALIIAFNKIDFENLRVK